MCALMSLSLSSLHVLPVLRFSLGGLKDVGRQRCGKVVCKVLSVV